MQYAGRERWSGYYSQTLNETNRKSNYCTSEKLKEKYLPYPYQKAAGYKMKLNKTCDQTWFLLKYDNRWENKGLYV